MNIYDISQKAGVSIATVSRVLNGSDKVSDKTRKKVLAVMEENSYTPNAFARSLGLNSMHTVGFSAPTPRMFIRRRPFIIWSGSCAKTPMHPCSAVPDTSCRKSRVIYTCFCPVTWMQCF